MLDVGEEKDKISEQIIVLPRYYYIALYIAQYGMDFGLSVIIS